MVVVKIELWPHGDQTRRRMLGEMRITNDGEGDEDIGNYNVQLRHSGRYWGKGGNWRTGKIVGFMRNMSPYHLVVAALQACKIYP